MSKLKYASFTLTLRQPYAAEIAALRFTKGPLRGEAVRTLFMARTKPKNNTMVLPTQAKGNPPPQKK